jgi:hypothetical protein
MCEYGGRGTDIDIVGAGGRSALVDGRRWYCLAISGAATLTFHGGRDAIRARPRREVAAVLESGRRLSAMPRTPCLCG